MPEEVGIVMKLYDQFSPTLKTISKNSKAFCKDMDDWEEGIKSFGKAQEELVKHSAKLIMALKEADEKVKDAQKSYRKLRDETSRGALEDAIEEQARLKNELKETEVVIKNNIAGYDQMYKQMRNAAEAAGRANNRADGNNGGRGGISSGNSTDGGLAGFAKSLLTAGIGQMVADDLGQLGSVYFSSAVGEPEARQISSMLSGIISGGTMGAMAGPWGILGGAVIGGISGTAAGWSEIYQAEDDAFKAYYRGLYEAGESARAESLTAGIDTASQRELDAIAFNKQIGRASCRERV